MLVNFLVDFLPILYHKVKNYCCLLKRHPLAAIDAMRINVPALKSQFGNLFWTPFYILHSMVATKATSMYYYTASNSTMKQTSYNSFLLDVQFILSVNTFLLLFYSTTKNINDCLYEKDYLVCNLPNKSKLHVVQKYMDIALNRSK